MFSFVGALCYRQLVMQYARHRAISGARFYRVDWTSLSDLPALPATCCRRMALLNSNCNIRRAVMRLCNLLGERYAMYLGRMRMIDEKEPVSQNSILAHESYSESNLSQYFWDNFEDPDVKIAVDEVLRYKRLAKFESVKRLGLKHGKRWPDIPPVDGTNTNVHESVCSCFLLYLHVIVFLAVLTFNLTLVLFSLRLHLTNRIRFQNPVLRNLSSTLLNAKN